MKFGLSIVLSLGLALSPLCALDSNAKLGVDSKKAVQSSSLSSADADFLFASNASHLNVVALSDEEMAETTGELDLATAILVGAGTGAGIAVYEATKDALNSIGKGVSKGVKRIKRWFR